MGRFKAYDETGKEVWIHDMYLEPYLEEIREEYYKKNKRLIDRVEALESLLAAKSRIEDKEFTNVLS